MKNKLKFIEEGKENFFASNALIPFVLNESELQEIKGGEDDDGVCIINVPCKDPALTESKLNSCGIFMCGHNYHCPQKSTN